MVVVREAARAWALGCSELIKMGLAVVGLLLASLSVSLLIPNVGMIGLMAES